MLVAIATLCLALVMGREARHASPSEEVQLQSLTDTPSLSSGRLPGRLDVLPLQPSPCSVKEQSYIDCSNLGLRHIPRDLPEDAVVLDFSNNSLTEIPREAFSQFQNLTALNFTNNSIATLHDLAFQGLTQLRELHLRSNRLNVSALTSRLFAPLTSSLTLLTLDGNLEEGAQTLTYPESVLASLQSLQELHLDAVEEINLGRNFSTLRNLTTLSFNGYHGTCYVTRLYNHTFENVPQLRVLELIQCNVSSIEPLAFEPLRQIHTLDLSNNRELGFKGMTIASYGLQHSPIKVLKLNFIHRRFATCIKIMKCHLRFLQNTELEEIQIDANNIDSIERGALVLVPKSLKVVSAQFNSFTFGAYMTDFDKLVNLISLDLSQTGRKHSLPSVRDKDTDDNVLHDPCPHLPSPNDTEEEETPRQPRLYEYGSDVENVNAQPFSVPLPPNLRFVSLRWNELFYDISAVNLSRNSLTELDFSYNLFSIWFGPLYGLQKVTRLDMAGNLASWMGKAVFQNFTSLEYLDISNNFLPGIMSEKNDSKMFEYLKSLKVFNISHNELYVLNKTSLHGLESLEVLNASRNQLVVENLLADISHMKNLSLVDFSRNNLNLLPREFCNALDTLAAKRDGEVQLDLSLNPIVCSCGMENLRFLHWLITTRVKLLNTEHYICLFPNGTTGPFWRNLGAVRSSCNNYLGLVLGCFATVFVVIGVTTGFITYRFRWKLRYLYYTARGSNRRNEYESLEGFEFDAFVLHDDDDMRFARELTNRLGKEGLNLLPSYGLRDGEPLLKSMVEAIQASRHTVCVISQNFFENNVLDYGLQMAIQESLHTDRNVVFMLLYDPVRARSLSRQVLYYIQTGAFVEFPQDDRCLPYFWDNLTCALKGRRRNCLLSLSSSSSSSSLRQSMQRRSH